MGRAQLLVMPIGNTDRSPRFRNEISFLQLFHFALTAPQGIFATAAVIQFRSRLRNLRPQS
jgi:hypothetical protein